MNRAAACALLLMLLTGTARADSHGTLDFSDIEDVLAQKKALFARITADFEVFRIGDARMINRAENIKLNGMRVGSYTFFAKPRGAPDPYTYEIRVETRPTFIDASGRKVTISKATDFKEELLDIVIRPLPPEKCFTPPSDPERDHVSDD